MITRASNREFIRVIAASQSGIVTHNSSDGHACCCSILLRKVTTVCLEQFRYGLTAAMAQSRVHHDVDNIFRPGLKQTAARRLVKIAYRRRYSLSGWQEFKWPTPKKVHFHIQLFEKLSNGKPAEKQVM